MHSTGHTAHHPAAQPAPPDSLSCPHPDQREREALWEILSDLFVDSEICWRGIIRGCAGYEPNLLRQILFDDVLPYCGPNIITPVPPIWTGFERESLITGIQAKRAEREASLWRQCLHTAQVWFYRWWFRELWDAFFTRLERAAAARTPEELENMLADPFFDTA